jgi:hypothetical protein
MSWGAVVLLIILAILVGALGVSLIAKRVMS